LGTAHLSKIITVLIEQNELLKQEIEWLRRSIGLREQGLSDEEISSRLGTNAMSYAETRVGLRNLTLSDVNFGVGFSNATKSNDKTVIGQGNNEKSYVKTGVGHGSDGKPYPDIGIGQTATLEPLPQIITPEMGVAFRLTPILHSSGVRYMSKKSLRNVATVMIHFYNKGSGAYPELKKLTSLSQGGVSKFMTSIRKRGLVKRYAYKKFELTPHGLNLLKQAYGKIKN
jgi:hypothetical protein